MCVWFWWGCVVSTSRASECCCAPVAAALHCTACMPAVCWALRWHTLTGLTLQVLGGVLHASVSAVVVRACLECRAGAGWDGCA